jgi:penicillin-binding protein 1C
LDRNGDLLRAYTVDDGRWRMTEGQVDPDFIAMLLAYEDKRFYQHAGVDPWAMLRAAAQIVTQGRIVSGASTLTMQVARLLENSGTGKVAGKLRQMRLALALERRLSKPQILSLYLRLAPYGGNLEGIRAASLSYFGKEPRRLTPAESALLIAIPQSPEARRPDHSTDPTARNRVLDRALGSSVIDNVTAAKTESLPNQRHDFPALAPHLADRAISAGHGLQLTIDKTLQISLEKLAADTVASLGARVQVAILAADHQSGEILASVGSAAFQADGRAGFVDMTQALRSPGSTLKPLIYGLAFDQGLGHPETLINDAPTDFNGYRPQNFDRHFRGMIRMREALQQSLNIPVVAITDAIGPANLLAAMGRAGMKPVLPNGQAGLAMALGGVGVTLQDMVQLYASIARGGVALPLITDLSAPRGEGQRVLSQVSAWQVGDILAGLPPPAGAPANRLAYKTGTSYGHRDAWAIGYDGRHVIGIWMGRPDGTPVPGAFGAELAAPVLFQAFGRLTLEPQPTAPAATLLVANAQLPRPLQHFRPRGAVFAESGPKLSFPPDGAEVDLLPEGLLVRVEGGTAPYTWLANGAPVATGIRDAALMLDHLGAGFVTLSVIDAAGQSARATVRLR